jgi:hypothetical protein
MVEEAIEETIDTEPRCPVVAHGRSSRMREIAAGFGCKTDVGALSRTKASVISA